MLITANILLEVMGLVKIAILRCFISMKAKGEALLYETIDRRPPSTELGHSAMNAPPAKAKGAS